jgi:hypothetical protein
MKEIKHEEKLARNPQVIEAIYTTETHVAVLGGLLGNFFTRLEGVPSECLPQEACPRETERFSASLATVIDGTNRNLENIIEGFEQLYARLEI